MAKVVTQAEIFATIKSLTGQANLLTIPRTFIDYTGDHESALLLSQIIYWSAKAGRQDGFIFKTYRDWQEEIGLKEYAVRKATNHLKEMGILETAVHKAYGNPTVHYRLIDSVFISSFLEFLKKRNCKNCINENPNLKESLTDTTLTNSTSEITEKDNASNLTVVSKDYVSEIIKIYFEKYRSHLEKEHPVIKEKQLIRIKSEITEFADEHFCGLDTSSYIYFEEMIERHFTRTDGLTTDFNINHFATQGIMSNLFYRHLY